MKHPGEDIRIARMIFQLTHGEQEAWKEVNVKRWMDNAKAITKEMRVETFEEALKQLESIPQNILKL